jgi:hypothetical protein
MSDGAINMGSSRENIGVFDALNPFDICLSSVAGSPEHNPGRLLASIRVAAQPPKGVLIRVMQS